MSFRKTIIRLAKNFLSGFPLALVKRMPERFKIDTGAVLLDSFSIRFDVKERTQAPCVVIADKAMVGCNFIFESETGKISIGYKTFVGPGTNLISRSSIDIGDNVFIGWGCCFLDHDSHSIFWEERICDFDQQLNDYAKSGSYVLTKDWTTVISRPIVVGNMAWLGFESVVLKGVSIGEGAIVGAKSVVTRDVPPWTMVAGNPARVIKTLVER